MVSQEPQAVQVSPDIKKEPSVHDIVGTKGLTHNGRCYAPGPSGVSGEEEGTEQSDVEVTVLKKKGKEPLNEPVSE